MNIRMSRTLDYIQTVIWNEHQNESYTRLYLNLYWNEYQNKSYTRFYLNFIRRVAEMSRTLDYIQTVSWNEHQNESYTRLYLNLIQKVR